MADSQIRFGRKLKIARISADLKQSDLAERAGIHQTYVSQLERGKRGNPTLETIEALEQFVVSDHDYVEMLVEAQPPHDAITLETDPMIILRPEGAWDEPGPLDRSASRPATNIGAMSR